MEYPFKSLMPLDETAARDGYYKDWTHIDANTFHQISELAQFIREKGYGADTREAIAQALERVYHDAMNSGNSNMEVSMARKHFKNLAARLDASDADMRNISVDWINKNLGKLDQTYMSDEFLQQIAGNSPVNAVPADRSLTTSKYADKSVTAIKTNFAKPLNLASKNLIYGKAILGSAGDYQFANLDSGVVDILKVDPNTTYTMYKEGSNRNGVFAFSNYPKVGDVTYDLIAALRPPTHHDTWWTFTTGTSTNYLVIYLSNAGEEPTKYQIQKGDIYTGYTDPKAVDIKLLNKVVSPEQTTFITKSNLFERNFIQDMAIMVTGYDAYIPQMTPITKDSITFYTKLEPNTTYTYAQEGGDRFRVGIHMNTPVAEKPISRMEKYEYTDGSLKTLTFTTGDIGLWLITQPLSKGNPEDVQLKLEYGSTFTGMEDKGFNIELGNKTLNEISNNIIYPRKVNLSVPPYKVVGDYIDDETFSSGLTPIYDLYDSLASHQPFYISKSLAGNEESGLPIYRYDFKPPSSINGRVFDPPKIILFGGTHGHERNVLSATYRFFYDLVHNYQESEALSKLRSYAHIIFIPALNAWGVENSSRTNFNGVDLNRNFAKDWTQTETGEYYSGTSPMTEIGTQIVEQIITSNPDAIYAIDFHNQGSFGQDGSFAYSTYTTEDNANLLQALSYRLDSEIRPLYPSYTNHENLLYAVYDRNLVKRGEMNKYFETLGIRGTILETSGSIGTSPQLQAYKDIQHIGAHLLGNLLAGVINNFGDI